MLIISTIQFKPSFSRSHAEVNDNIRRCIPLIRKAGGMKSSLIVLPELAFTGYSFMSKDEVATVAESWDGSTFQVMAEMAKELDAYVAWGYAESDGNDFFNSATIASPSGEAIVRHRKMNLFSNDFLWAKPGNKTAEVVESNIGNLSVVICRDMRDKVPKNAPGWKSGRGPIFPNKKPDIVAACVNWGKGGFPSTTWMDFAADNSCVVAIANRWGADSQVSSNYEQDFGQGGSAIVGKDWRVYTDGLVFSSDCVVTAAIEEGPIS